MLAADEWDHDRLVRLNENGNIVADLTQDRWIGHGGRLEKLGNMVLWTNGNGRVLALHDPASDQTFWGDFDYWRSRSQNFAPRPDYEFTESYAKTPTHIFAKRGGELFRMPLKNIAQKNKISLPKEFDHIAIIGLTKQWLFVTGGQRNEDGALLSFASYRSAMRTQPFRLFSIFLQFKTGKYKQLVV